MLSFALQARISTCNLTVTHVWRIGIILYNFRNSAVGTQKILSGYDSILLPTRKQTHVNELRKNASELRIFDDWSQPFAENDMISKRLVCYRLVLQLCKMASVKWWCTGTNEKCPRPSAHTSWRNILYLSHRIIIYNE